MGEAKPESSVGGIAQHNRVVQLFTGSLVPETSVVAQFKGSVTEEGHMSTRAALSPFCLPVSRPL